LLSENLDKQINVFRNNIHTRIDESKTNDQRGEPRQTPGASKPQESVSTKKPVNYDRTSNLDLRMDGLKYWASIGSTFIIILLITLLLPKAARLISAGIGALTIVVLCCSSIIRVFKTRYRIKESSVENTFSFLSRSTMEFSFEKVTAITFQRSILDRLVGTQTIIFWSIGAGQPLQLQCVRISDDIKKMILAKIGVYSENKEEIYGLSAAFSPSAMICANLFAFLFLLMLLFGFWAIFPSLIPVSLIIVISIIGLSYLILTMYHKRSRLQFYDDHIQFTHGLLTCYHQCALYENIKDITTIKFPMINKGRLQFNIAGESIATQANQRQRAGARRGFMLSFAFTFKYADNIKLLDEIIDSIFIMSRSSAASVSELINTPPEHIYTDRIKAQSSFLNPLIKGCFTAIAILVPLVLTALWLDAQYQIWTYAVSTTVLLLIILLIIIQARARKYSIQNKRVLARSGIIYQKQTTVIFDRIDFINCQQGALNKICGNGNITVNTAGSSKPEVTIKDIANYREFYNELKATYK